MEKELSEFSCKECGRLIPLWRLSCPRLLWRSTCSSECQRKYRKEKKELPFGIAVQYQPVQDKYSEHSMTARTIKDYKPKYRYGVDK